MRGSGKFYSDDNPRVHISLRKKTVDRLRKVKRSYDDDRVNALLDYAEEES